MPAIEPEPREAGAMAKEVLALLNAISVSEVGRVLDALRNAEAALDGSGHPEMALKLASARRSLVSGDTKEFRRAISNVTARLGHLK